jgi:hypothetical protein
MFTIGGGTAQILRTVVAGRTPNAKMPQTRDGYTKLAEAATAKGRRVTPKPNPSANKPTPPLFREGAALVQAH